MPDAILPSGLMKMRPTLNRSCRHERTQLIAKDSDAQYIECLDCGEIFEAQELEKQEKEEGSGFGESLSDA
ncbi:MAG: hypothetical protein WBC67_07490 [Candidatus Acidiferrales bacterium]